MSITALGQSLVGVIPGIMVVLAGAGLVVTLIGFARLVWFISIGYGYSITVMAIITLVASARAVGGPGHAPLLWAQGLLLAAYGLRLGTFLLIRDMQSSFRGEVQATKELNGSVPLVAKVGIWLTVVVLYVAMISPFAFHADALAAVRAGTGSLPQVSAIETLVTAVGVLVSLSGLVIEATADFQKSGAKRLAPSRFCDTGLFRVVRFPNYFGEILVWLGSWIAAAPFFRHWSHWLIGSAGLLVITLIMLGSAKRLELKQERRYGDDPEFQAYSAAVPAIVPFISLYSLRNVRFAIGWGSHDFGSVTEPAGRNRLSRSQKER